jgi:hypothetical protein
MDWMSTLRYGLILQQERLQRAREPWRGLSVPTVHKWVRAVRSWYARRSLRAGRASDARPPDRIAQAGGPA